MNKYFFTLALVIMTLLSITTATAQENMDQTEQNKQTAITAVTEFWSEDNLKIAFDVYAKLSIFHFPVGDPDKTQRYGAGGIMSYYDTNWIQGFPDKQFTILNVIASDDLVVIQYSFHGTLEHFTYIPSLLTNGAVLPTGEDVTWEGVFIFRFEDGKIAEEWWYWNNELMDSEYYKQKERRES